VLQRLRATRENDKGFTLVELLIVIVILGVLAGIVVFAVNGITDRGEIAACKADVKSVQVASEAYYAKNNVYAQKIEQDTATPPTWTSLVPNFLQTAPKSTKYKISYLVSATDPPVATVTGHLKADGSGADCFA
jgi:prepilin-type N-terminal cleavage/methylation domain-containing protein